MLAFLDQCPDKIQLPVRQPVILRQLNLRVDPELRLTRLAMDMNMHPGLLSGEKVESKPALPIVDPSFRTIV
jgi:hypothetical protein